MVEITDLTVRFGKKTVLDCISLSVAEGEIVAIMGSSGGGKTTLLKCVSGLLTPTSGSVIVSGIDVTKDPESARLHMGLVFQSAALFDFMTVAENILFGVRRRFKLGRDDAKQVVKDSLERVGLGDIGDQFPGELSGGMRKRVGIARALALKPKVILYDEPTTGLDPVTAYTIDAEIAELRSELGVTSLVVTHDVTAVFRLADRVAFLDSGKLAFLGTPGEFETDQHEGIKELLFKAQTRSVG
ncbi:MAG: ATP-binding cassette domain-containing protein [Fimbriimonadaceae bacterium]